MSNKILMSRKLVISVITLFLAACAATDPNAPVDDDYNTSFYWPDYKSTALNLLRTARMDKQYEDVDSKEDIADIRDRNTTLGNLFSNVANLAVFDVGMMAYSISQNDDDIDERFLGPTYVTYVPVNSDELSVKEQLDVRLKAIANFENTLHASGSDQSKAVFWKKIGRFLYMVNLNGEACDIAKNAFVGSGLLPCSVTIEPRIAKVIKKSKLPDYIAKNFTTGYVASVTVKMTRPHAAVVMAKNLQGSDFIAFPDKYVNSYYAFVTSVPVVVQGDKIHSFFSPRKNVTPYDDSEVMLAVHFKRSKATFTMPVITDDDAPSTLKGSKKNPKMETAKINQGPSSSLASSTSL